MVDNLFLLGKQEYQKLNVALVHRLNSIEALNFGKVTVNQYYHNNFLYNVKYVNNVISPHFSFKEHLADALFQDFILVYGKGIKHFRDPITKELYVISLYDCAGQNIFLYKTLPDSNLMISNNVNILYKNRFIPKKVSFIQQFNYLSPIALIKNCDHNSLVFYNNGRSFQVNEPLFYKRELMITIFYRALLSLVNELIVSTCVDVSGYKISTPGHSFGKFLRFISKYSSINILAQTVRRHFLFVQVRKKERRLWKFPRRIELIKKRVKWFIFRDFCRQKRYARFEHRLLIHKLVKFIFLKCRLFVRKFKFFDNKNQLIILKKYVKCRTLYMLKHVKSISIEAHVNQNALSLCGNQSISFYEQHTFTILINVLTKNILLKRRIQSVLSKTSGYSFKLNNYLNKSIKISTLVGFTQLLIFKNWRLFYRKLLYRFLKKRVNIISILGEKRRRRRDKSRKFLFKFGAERSFLVPLFVYRLSWRMRKFHKIVRSFNYNFYKQLAKIRDSDFITYYSIIYTNLIWYNFYYWFLSGILSRFYKFYNNDRNKLYFALGVSVFSENFSRRFSLGLKYLYFLSSNKLSVIKTSNVSYSFLVLYLLLFFNKFKINTVTKNSNLILLLIYNYLFKFIGYSYKQLDFNIGFLSSVLFKFFTRFIFLLIFVNRLDNDKMCDLIVLDLVLKSFAQEFFL